MHFNHPFCGNSANAFNNGNGFGYNTYYPPPINNGFYSHSIVGEGDVTCVTLPDGTCQFYFTPTASWCTSNTYPGCNITNLNNINPYCNPNIGSWFVRSITSPIPAICHDTSYPRHDAPIPFLSLDYNRNAIDNGFQLKFHNDKWTSTTDIHYFYPCLRHIDYTLVAPARGCAAVQVDTPIATNTVCHYEVVCSKPCHSNHNRVTTSVSAMSMDANTKPTETVTCQSYTPIHLKRGPTNNSLQRLQLLPSDARKKRIKLELKKHKVGKSKSKDVICDCSQSPCDCCPSPSGNKNVRIACKTNSKLNKSVQSSRCYGQQASVVKQEPEMWQPSRDSLENIFQCECSPPLSSEKVTQNVINSKTTKDIICQCSPSVTSETTQHVNESKSKDVICQCDPPIISQNVNESKSKDGICQCDPPPSSEKSIATPDVCTSSCCDLKKRTSSTRSNRKQRLVIKGKAFSEAEPEMWCPVTDSLQKLFQCGKGSSKTACCSSCCD